jgi:hypothetical protein
MKILRQYMALILLMAALGMLTACQPNNNPTGATATAAVSYPPPAHGAANTGPDGYPVP